MNRGGLVILSLLFLQGVLLTSARADIFNFVDTDSTRLSQMVLVDARELAECQGSSVTGARCLPAQTFQSAQGELASFRDITWVFGTADLQHSDEVLVFADDSYQRDAVIGLLYLAGHQQLWRWPGSTKELQKVLGPSAGQTRALTRSSLYQGVMRDHFIVIEDELEGYQQTGWYLVGTDVDQTQKTQALIAAAGTPLALIALFAQLKSAGYQSLKVVVDKLYINRDQAQQNGSFSPLLLMILAVLTVIMIFVLRWGGHRGHLNRR